MMNDITKINLIKTCNNDMQYCKYYMVYCRLYNKGKTKYYRMHFIMQLDIQDVQEYYDKMTITKSDWNEYKYESAYGIVNQYNYNNINSFCDYCNKTLENWNRCGGQKWI